MQFKPAPLCALLVTALSATAQAQPLQPSAPVPSVIVTGNPLGSALFEMVPPVSALESPDLQLRAQGTLGETLGRTPGVHSTYFGPGASRPIIRGMDGDRIRILQNSIGTLDASGLSYDHAVPIDPISVDRIEVVRGPATLFYGGSAMGGVVNVLTNRIPEKAVMGLQGSVDSRFGGAERERGLGAKLEAGNGRFALHADGSWRNTSDLKIPGFARSARQRATDAATVDQPNGEVPNTSSQTSGGALGGSFTWDQGFAGVSYTSLSTNYGSPAERNVRLDMHSGRYDAGGEVRGLRGFITSVKFKAAYTDYVHREINGGIVSTNFLNKGHEGRIEATHAPIGPFKGAFGVQIGKSRFSALGSEAYVPTTLTETRALYLFEELALGTGKLSFGARHERTSLGTAANANLLDASTGRARFGTEQAKRFGASSASLGAYVPVGPVALTANLARTERAPTQAELFAYGPHAATGTYELGNANLGVEKSNGLDLGIKWRSGAHSASVSAYQTRFTNYMTGFLTGTNRDEDGTINAAGNFRELSYRQTAARFTGFEGEARFRLLERPATLYLELMADAVTATNTATGEPLPRIPSARFGAGLHFATSTWSAKIEGTRSAAQSRVPAGDTATDGYTLWNAYGSYRLSLGNTRALGWVRLANLTNREARMASSILRERVPLGGRALSVGIKVDF